MNILFVEDNVAFADGIAPIIRSIDHVKSLHHAVSLETATSALEENFFDLVILDMKIPPSDTSLDIAVEHGQRVFHLTREKTPGTPIFILTASEPDDFALKLARFGGTHDLWGGGYETNILDYFKKEETIELIEKIKALASVLHDTDSVTLNSRGRSLNLTSQQERILKVYTRRAGGVSCDIAVLNGGLSDTRVVRAVAQDDQGRTLHVCAGKLGSIEKVEEEHRAFEQHVTRLTIGTFPPKFCMIDKALTRTCGLFYTLAEGDITLFDFTAQRRGAAAGTVDKVRTSLSRWSDARSRGVCTVGDIRRHLLPDSKLESLRDKFDLDFVNDIEAETLRSSRSCIHGDLHAANVLVRTSGDPILIDFGDVGVGPTVLDPVTLELSFLFHPDGVANGQSASLSGLISSWPDIDSYLDGNPLKDIVNACRNWAHDVSGSDRDVLASAYAYTIRQLKYETIEPSITIELLKSICTKF